PLTPAATRAVHDLLAKERADPVTRQVIEPRPRRVRELVTRIAEAPGEVDVTARADSFAEAAQLAPDLTADEQVRRARERPLTGEALLLVDDPAAPGVPGGEAPLVAGAGDRPRDRPRAVGGRT